jgi:hypothetical protein
MWSTNLNQSIHQSMAFFDSQVLWKYCFEDKFYLEFQICTDEADRIPSSKAEDKITGPLWCITTEISKSAHFKRVNAKKTQDSHGVHEFGVKSIKKFKAFSTVVEELKMGAHSLCTVVLCS